MSPLESLYPFLYAEERTDPAMVLDDVRRSSIAKIEEIVELRRTVADRDGARLDACAAEMAAAFAAGGRLFAFGNGGSSSDAQDLAGLFLHPGGLPAFALTGDAAVMTALSNDIGFDVVFSRQLAALGRRGDIAVGLSTSGNSPNLLRAFEEAASRGMLTVGLVGDGGGEMAGRDDIDHLFVVPSTSVHRIQEAQTTIYQVLWELTVSRGNHD
ncbi:SIS domain-containing protein [Nonomuraea sp. NPDC046570]|uniref:D-sedoheptulose-7-phosphate isomerase n=1 Tax=Nonomuraea sp. NPDC046570 TaxID=3155255 RepID=UPI0033FAF7C0